MKVHSIEAGALRTCGSAARHAPLSTPLTSGKEGSIPGRAYNNLVDADMRRHVCDERDRPSQITGAAASCRVRPGSVEQGASA
jgi:hypothetical protein